MDAETRLYSLPRPSMELGRHFVCWFSRKIFRFVVENSVKKIVIFPPERILEKISTKICCPNDFNLHKRFNGETEATATLLGLNNCRRSWIKSAVFNVLEIFTDSLSKIRMDKFLKRYLKIDCWALTSWASYLSVLCWKLCFVLEISILFARRWRNVSRGIWKKQNWWITAQRFLLDFLSRNLCRFCLKIFFISRWNIAPIYQDLNRWSQNVCQPAPAKFGHAQTSQVCPIFRQGWPSNISECT